MDTVPSDLRATLESVVRAVLMLLAAYEPSPTFVRLPDQTEWRRQGQESLYQAQREVWQHPEFLMSSPWWNRLPQMGEFRSALEATGLNQRVDTLVGFEFSAVGRDLLPLLINEILAPLVIARRSYEFDEGYFSESYDRFEQGLRQESGRLVEVLPMLGFNVSSAISTTLPGGREIRLMTDRELSFAIQTMGVPVESMFGTNNLQVSYSNQFALVKTHTFPLRFGHLSETKPGPDLASFAENATPLVTALRLVCGGSVAPGRPMQLRHADDFDARSGYSASRTGVTPPDSTRTTVIVDQIAFDLAKTFAELLVLPDIVDDRPLQMALRRIVSAGAPAAPADRLIDLLIAAEALLIQRLGLPRGGSKSDKLADGVIASLAINPEFAGRDNELRQLIIAAYKRRNEEMHADAAATQLYRLNGETTDDLASMVGDLEQVVRRIALNAVAEIATATITPAPNV